jgi:hypothetical protein
VVGVLRGGGNVDESPCGPHWQQATELSETSSLSLSVTGDKPGPHVQVTCRPICKDTGTCPLKAASETLGQAHVVSVRMRRDARHDELADGGQVVCQAGTTQEEAAREGERVTWSPRPVAHARGMTCARISVAGDRGSAQARTRSIGPSDHSLRPWQPDEPWLGRRSGA